MVYCGKPSRGCQMCRTRRIKCDETKPTCNQCAKSRRQCPGYKDEFDLVFRNETQATERRAKKANRKALAAKLGQNPESPPSEVSSSPSSSSPSSVFSTVKDGSQSPISAVSPGLEIPVEQQASCYFVSNFVLVPRQGGTRGFMEYLLPLMKTDAANQHLQQAFNAVAMAALGNRANDYRGEIAGKAGDLYGKALVSMTSALKSPESSKSDATLAAILLLGLFENVTATKVGMLAWGTHVEGAIQIVRSRGRKQLRTKTGLHLFIAVRTQMIIHNLASGQMPVMGTEWWLNDAVKDEAAAQCQRLSIRVAEVRAEVTRLMTTAPRTPENVTIVQGLMKRAETIDQEIIMWMRSLPDQYQYKTVHFEDHVPNGDYYRAEVFPGRVDVYQDFWTASVWNMARVSRLALSSAIVRCVAWVCSPVDYRTTREYAATAADCVEIITDILASVPYHLGWHLRRPDLVQRSKLSSFECGEEDTQKGLAGYFLTWPLTCVNGQDYATDAQRQWVIGRLRYIGDELGIRYAHMLSELQVRVPSMLIRRDGLMAQPYHNAHNFEKLLNARLAPPTAGYTMNPIQQREAMQKAYVEQSKSELLAKATGKSGQSGEWIAQKWLAV